MDMPGIKKGKKGFWSRKRIIAIFVWLALFFSVAIGAEILLPGSGYIPCALLFAAGTTLYLNRTSFIVGIAFVSLIAIFYLFKPQTVTELLEGLNFHVENAFYNLKGSKKASNQIVFVDIDQKTLEESP